MYLLSGGAQRSGHGLRAKDRRIGRGAKRHFVLAPSIDAGFEPERVKWWCSRPLNVSRQRWADCRTAGHMSAAMAPREAAAPARASGPFEWMVPQRALDNLKYYKYGAVDKSPITKYIMKPYWDWAVTLFPMWMAYAWSRWGGTTEASAGATDRGYLPPAGRRGSQAELDHADGLCVCARQPRLRRLLPARAGRPAPVLARAEVRLAGGAHPLGASYTHARPVRCARCWGALALAASPSACTSTRRSTTSMAARRGAPAARPRWASSLITVGSWHHRRQRAALGA